MPPLWLPVMEPAGTRAGPPCVVQEAKECKANPSRVSIYQQVPAEYRERHGLGAGASCCRSHKCKRICGLMPQELGRPGRKRAGESSPSTSSASPSVVEGIPARTRKLPKIVVQVYEIKQVRHTTVDYEHPTNCEDTLEARRSCTPHAKGDTMECAVHGEFRMHEDGARFPDTYWFTPKQLKDAGIKKEAILDKLDAYHQELKEANEQVDSDLSDDEEGYDGG